MKSKIVLWGENARQEKVLVAVSLRVEDNKVDIWMFPESIATEDFYQKMMSEWRDGEGLEFPDTCTHLERELSVSESLLPDDLKVERTDLLHRAQTEWHFNVLSEKLHQAYLNEVAELKEKVETLTEFSQPIWDRLKEFWDKVQEQVNERNLFREHSDQLKTEVNALFARLKELRAKLDEELERKSKEVFDKFTQAIENVEKKIKEGTVRFPLLFDELKNLQRQFRKEDLTRTHRNIILNKIDVAFKELKRKKFGDQLPQADDSPFQRLKRRYEGLLSAIHRMEQSIRSDNKDLEFQRQKIATTDGQLEAQIRQAKLLMIEERLRSKKEKLADMNATRLQLEKRMVIEEERENRRAAKEAVKEKIAGKIKTAAIAREDESEVLEKAAEEINLGKHKAGKAADHADEIPPQAKEDSPKEDSLLDALSATVGESLEDVVDTVKAVAAVVSEKIEEALDDLKEKLTTEAADLSSADATQEQSVPSTEKENQDYLQHQKEDSMTNEEHEVALVEDGVGSEIAGKTEK